MSFLHLRELRDKLSKKTNRTSEEEAILRELVALGRILDRNDFSLAMSSNCCPTCGRSLEK